MGAKKKAVAKKGAKTPDAARLVRERERLAKALAKKVKVLRALRSEGASSWDRLWETVGDIVLADPPLWRGTHRSEAEFVAKELPGEDPRAVRRNVLVAGTFSPKDIEDVGPTRLEELALYLMDRARTKRPPRGVDLDRVMVVVPRESGGESMRISGRVAELAQLREARRAIAREKGTRGGASAKVGKEERVIRAGIAKKKSLAGVTVRVAKGTVVIGKVPIGAVRDLGEVLRKLVL